VHAEKLLAIPTRDAPFPPRFPHHGWKLYFLCRELSQGEPDGIETDALGFYGEDELPQLSFRLPPAHLERVFAHLRDPSLPTEFE
jgi:hypothetical protein